MRPLDHFPLRRFITVTPFGRMFIVAQGRYVAGCCFVNSAYQPAEMGIWAHPADPVIEKVATQLSEYADGSREYFELECAPAGNEFAKRVWQKTSQIPYGHTATYGQVAQALGNRHLARAVGRALATNPLQLIVPCHRVVAENGLGGYGAGQEVKNTLIFHEAQHYECADPATGGGDTLF